MDSGIVSYIRAFGVRWFVAMSGPLSVPLAVVGYIVQNEVAKFALFATALLCAIFASYWVWKVEREARIKAENEINIRRNRKNIRVALGGFLTEGQALMSRCDDVTTPPPNEDADSWGQKVEVFLLDNFDESYVARFRDGTGVPLAARVSREQPSLPHVNLWSALRIRVFRLQEFIKELSI